MTVGELIAVLSDLPFERDVWLDVNERRVTGVEALPGIEDAVWVLSE